MVERFGSAMLAVTKLESETHLAAVTGELDLASVDDIGERLRRIECPTTLLDLSEVTFLDAHSLGVLLELRREIEERGDRFVVTGAHGVARRVFAVAGFSACLEPLSSTCTPPMGCRRGRRTQRPGRSGARAPVDERDGATTG